jgi:integrase/recombinase XerC
MRTYQKAFEEAAISTGLMDRKPGIHFHSLRHGFATQCQKKGMKLEYTQMLMGHQDISTTMVYTHISPDKPLKAYEEAF